MQDQWFTFSMFDAEAWFVRDVILGKVTLPTDKKVRSADMAKWAKRCASLTSGAEMIDFQRDYIIDLMSAIEDFPKYDARGAAEQFHKWKKAKAKGIVTYRDTQHTSVVTGNVQAVHHTPWWNTKADTIDAFLSDKTLALEL